MRQKQKRENNVYPLAMQQSGSQYTTISQEFVLKKRLLHTVIAEKFDEAYQNI